MARIRSHKPSIFRHEELQDLEAANPGASCMLVFMAVWGHCDNQGVFEYRPRQLKLDILPFLPFDMAATLRLLVDAGFIRVFEAGGKQYGFIASFCGHQRITGDEAGEKGRKHPSPPDAKQPRNSDETSAKQLGGQEKEREREGNMEEEGIPYGTDAKSRPSGVSGGAVTGTDAPDKPVLVEPGEVEPWATVAACLNRVAELLEVAPPTEGQIRQHLRETSHLRQLLARHGPEKAAQMFVWASSHFRQRVTWTVVWNAEADVLAKMAAPNGRLSPGDHLSRIVDEAEALGA